MFWTDKRPYKTFEFWFDTFGKENGNSKSIIHSPKSIHYFVSLFYLAILAFISNLFSEKSLKI